MTSLTIYQTKEVTIMLNNVKAAVACAWSDLLAGDHRWCVRGALAVGVALGWLAGASLC
tara:strand:+ start:718 stop:894 length:177 start_codon:yes stop_codon:yes gene_type:complete